MHEQLTIFDKSRRCKGCGTEWPLTAKYFRVNRSKSNPTGFRFRCKACEASPKGCDLVLAKMLASDGYRVCTQCLEALPATLNFFGSMPGSPDGLHPHCRICTRARSRDRYCNESTEQHERRMELMRRYVEANRTAVLEYTRAYSKQNYAKLLKWRRDNPERVRAWNQNRRARLAGASGSHTSDDVLAIYRKQGGKCAYCREDLDDTYNVDHVIPISRGGSNDPSNLCCACQPCNFSKGAKTGDEFRALAG